MNVIEEFGQLTLQELRAYKLPIGLAQNSHMIYYCIINTINKEANSIVLMSPTIMS